MWVYSYIYSCVFEYNYRNIILLLILPKPHFFIENNVCEKSAEQDKTMGQTVCANFQRIVAIGVFVNQLKYVETSSQIEIYRRTQTIVELETKELAEHDLFAWVLLRDFAGVHEVTWNFRRLSRKAIGRSYHIISPIFFNGIRFWDLYKIFWGLWFIKETHAKIYSPECVQPPFHMLLLIIMAVHVTSDLNTVFTS